jgi:hypothetical protein
VRVIVCGSREYRRLDLVRAFVDTLDLFDVVIVGGARGPDDVAERRAYERGLGVELYRAEWARYGRSAGYRRNAEMLKANPQRLAAFHDGSSRGTAYMIREGRRLGLDVEVWGPDGVRTP